MKAFYRTSPLTRMTLLALGAFLALGMAPAPAAAEVSTLTVIIKDHKFEPAEIVAPANVKFALLVKNLDPTPEEFESYELNREKIVAGNGEIKIFLGPLKPGTYPFFGEFNPKTAQGKIIVK